jgi:molybdenum cofactor cytidylyltransferase
MLSSIQAGLIAINGQAEAALIVLGDQPMVQPGTISALVSAWRDASPRPRIILPTCGGRHGHPVLLDAEGFADVLALPTSDTLRSYTNRQRERTLEVHVDDPSILHDLDTPDDYAAALQRRQDGDFTVRSA